LQVSIAQALHWINNTHTVTNTVHTMSIIYRVIHNHTGKTTYTNHQKLLLIVAPGLMQSTVITTRDQDLKLYKKLLNRLTELFTYLKNS